MPHPTLCICSESDQRARLNTLSTCSDDSSSYAKRRNVFFLDHDVERHVNSVEVNDVVTPVCDSNQVNLRFVHITPLKSIGIFFERVTDLTVVVT